MKAEHTIRPYGYQDWPAISGIWQEGIDTGLATFETEPKSKETFEKTGIPRTAIVAAGNVQSNESVILGWAVCWPVSDRCCYSGVNELSVYVSNRAKRAGVGRALLLELIAISEAKGIWTLQAGILADNTASIALHQICGFKLVGIREKLGKRDGVWHDVALMERRSLIVGT